MTIKNFLDMATWVYIAAFTISGYGLILFAWWWKKMGRATEIYAYVTFLFFGIMVSAALGVYARHLHIISEPRYNEFVTSYVWASGPLLIVLVVFVIVFRMTRRVFGDQIVVEVICPHCNKPCHLYEELVSQLKSQQNNIKREEKK